MSRDGKRANLDTADLPALPEGWCWVPLADISDIEGGITKDQKRPRSPTMREVPYLRVANVQRGFLDLEEIKTIIAEEDEIKSLRLQKGDVLFTEGGDRDKLGRGWVWNDEIEECIHQNHIFRARTFLGVVDPKFVSFHGNYFGQKWFVRTGKQTTNLASINKAVLSRFPVPLAPTNEQRRIVAKIDELFSDLDAGVAALQRVKANLKRYRAAVLKAAVEGRLTSDWRAKNPPKETGPQLLQRILKDRRKKWEEHQLATYAKAGKSPPPKWKEKYKEPKGPDETSLRALPDGWCWAQFVQCAHDITVGHVGPMKDEYLSEGIPFLRSQNVRPLRFEPANLKFIPPSFHATLSKSVLHGGELLVVRSGTIGDACVYPKDQPEANCADLVITRPLKGLMPEYAAIFVVSPPGRIAVGSRQTGIALTHFNIGAMRLSVLPFPPEDEQRQIIGEVERRLSIVEEAEAQIDANLKRSNRLRQSILKRAFEGKLVPQDPNDEPAAMLLERINGERKQPNTQKAPRNRPARKTR